MPLTTTAETQRIQTLDILRGFALLGILLINILGFGLASSSYSYAAPTIAGSSDLIAWVLVDLGFEGSMRGLFSILFGAGVLLFLDREASGKERAHFKRNAWLLIFGLVNGYLLLWSGDILLTYALAGFVLFFFRNLSTKELVRWSVSLFLLLALYNGLLYGGLHMLRSAHVETEALIAEGKEPSAQQSEMANEWQIFKADYQPGPESIAEELDARGESYSTAFSWNLNHNTAVIAETIPTFLLPDAFVMMLIGMALYRLGVLQGQRSVQAYRNMAIGGFTLGLLINACEIGTALAAPDDLLAGFSQLQPTYHVGRLAISMGWLGLVILTIKTGWLANALAAVGRMALTNYLMQSVLCLFIFTGAGLGLVGELARYQLYVVVLFIWVFQLWFSPWWLKRYQFGPVEWAWRGLTYGQTPRFKR